MEQTKVLKCSCQDEQQDKLYRVGFRLMNHYGKPHKGCTVCGKEHQISDRSKK